MGVGCRLGVFLLVLVLGALPAAARVDAQTPVTLFLDSQPGDYIGQGERHTWTDAHFAFSASVSADRSLVIISTNIVDSTWWTLNFAAPAGTPLVPGDYEFATRYPFQAVHLNGLSVSGSSRGCNASVGRFRVYEIAVNAAGAIERFAADFEQHCEGRAAALFGAIRYGSTRSSVVPFDGAYPDFGVTITPTTNGYVTGPGINCGAGRTDCTEAFAPDTTIALNAVPNPGYVFVGWAGYDCEGQASVQLRVTRRSFCTAVFSAQTGTGNAESPVYSANAAYLDTPFGMKGEGPSKRAFVAPASRVAVAFATPSRVAMWIDDARLNSTTIEFEAPVGAVLAPGLYQPTTPFFDHGTDPRLAVPYLCQSGGRFLIHEIAFNGDVLTAFSADFETPCGTGIAGSIRYNAARETLLPFDGAYPRPTLAVAPTIGGYVTGPGIDCGDGGRTTCEAGLGLSGIVSLQALPSPGYDFLGWGGFCSGRTPIATVTVLVSARCIALFHPTVGNPTAPITSLGDGTLLIHRPGSTHDPEFSLWTTPDGVVVPAPFSRPELVRLDATSMWGTGSIAFSLGGARVIPGEYFVDASDASPTAPWVSVNGCSATIGFFKIYEATFDASNALTAFAADFELYCGPSDWTKYLAGAVRYRSSRDVVRPYDGAYPAKRLFITRSLFGTVTGAGIACGHATTDCDETYPAAERVALQALPKAGYKFVGWVGACEGGSQGFVLVDQPRKCEPLFGALRPGTVPDDPRLAAGTLVIHSEAGDPVGKGEHKVRLTDSWTITLAGAISGFVFGNDWQWQFEFRPALTGTNRDSPAQVLKPGTYDGAVGFGVNPLAPSLSVAPGYSSACQPQLVRGRFVIHEFTTDPARPWIVTSLAIDFEQICGTAPPLRGAIRWRSQRSEIEPFADGKRVYSRFDFNGDGHADLLWQNRQDGRLLIWNMDRTSHFFDQPPSVDQVPDTNWHIVGNADANGDGYNDLYWQHQTTGALAIWLMRDTLLVSGDSMSPAAVPDINWKVRTVVDLDRDGHPDLIWQHKVTGQIAVWFMNGHTLRSGELLGPGRVADTNWTIVGAADGDADGYADLYWHHIGTGDLAIWFMRGVHLLRGEPLSPSRVADTNWRVRGVADLDRNGTADLIWQHLTTSDLAVWLLNGLRLVDGRHITGPVMPAAAWTLVGPR